MWVISDVRVFNFKKLNKHKPYVIDVHWLNYIDTKKSKHLNKVLYKII